jgi:hypothetical protein
MYCIINILNLKLEEMEKKKRTKKTNVSKIESENKNEFEVGIWNLMCLINKHFN